MTTEFRILGPLEVVHDGEEISLGAPQQRALLALLLTRAGQVVSRGRLIDELWRDQPPEAAVNILQTYVSRLRKQLPPGRLETRAPGYLVVVAPGELDLERFEALREQARMQLAAGEGVAAAALLREALALWRGPALADLASVLAPEAERLDALRLATTEDMIDAELALGHHASVITELERLVSEYPLRERLRGQLMLGLYRAGRQQEALWHYRDLRERLVETIGVEPGPELRERHAAILRQERKLWVEPRSGSTSVVLVCFDDAAISNLGRVARDLIGSDDREVVIVRVAADAADLPRAAAAATAARGDFDGHGIAAHAVALTLADPEKELARVAQDSAAELVLVDLHSTENGMLPEATAAILKAAPCVAVACAARDGFVPTADAPILVPFGGGDHEWAAVEFGARLARSEGRRLQLAGIEADAVSGRRDASSLLARAALLVQQATRTDTEPLLVGGGAADVVAAAARARAVVMGLADDWRVRGLGRARSAIIAEARPPVFVVSTGTSARARRGLTVTRYTWSVGSTT